MRGLNAKRWAGVVLAWSGILAAIGNVRGDAEAARDRLGDPLPLGAVARLGTIRLRMGGGGMALALSHDGKLVAAVDSTGELRVWSTASGMELAHCPRQDRGPALSFSPNDKTLASVSVGGGTIFLFDLSVLSNKEKSSILLKEPNPAIHYRGNPAVVLAFLPDGKTLLSGDIDGQAHLWDIGSGNEVRQVAAAAKARHRYTLSPDGKTLAVAADGEAPTLWDVATGKRIGRMPGREGVVALAFSPDSKHLAAGIANRNTIRIADVASRKELRLLRDDPMPTSQEGESLANALAYLPDGKTLVSLGGHAPKKIRIWDADSGALRRSIPVSNGDDRLLALSSDGRMLATTGWSNVVRLRELPSGKALHGELGQGCVGAVAVSRDSRHAALGSYGGFVHIYDRGTGAEVRSFRAGPHLVDHLAYTPDGKALFAAVAYHNAKLWNLTTGKEIRSFSGVANNYRGLWRAAFVADGTPQRLAVCSSSLQLLNAANGQMLRRLGEKQWPTALAFSPDGTQLAAGGPDRTSVHLWDVASGKELWVAHNKTGDIAALAFAPDGGSVAMSDQGQCLYLLNAADGNIVRSVIGMKAQVLDFSPDGRLLAAGGDHHDVLLVETATGTAVRRLRGHKGPVWALAFSPDGRNLVTGSWDATGLVWDMTGRAFLDKQLAVLSDSDLKNMWNDLGAAEGATGYDAVWRLLSSGKQGLAFLQARLPRQAPDSQTIARLIVQLDDDAFAVREKASAALVRMGHAVQTPLKEALAKKPSPEVRRRIEAILEKVGDKGDARLRGLRLLAVLEYADAPEARTLLQRLADKDPSEEIRRAARGALKRQKNAASKP